MAAPAAAAGTPTAPPARAALGLPVSAYAVARTLIEVFRGSVDGTVRVRTD